MRVRGSFVSKVSNPEGALGVGRRPKGAQPPACAKADGKVVVFFKCAGQFQMRYAEVGCREWANLDDSYIWPTVFAVATMSSTVENKLAALVKRADRLVVRVGQAFASSYASWISSLEAAERWATRTELPNGSRAPKSVP